MRSQFAAPSLQLRDLCSPPELERGSKPVGGMEKFSQGKTLTTMARIRAFFPRGKF